MKQLADLVLDTPTERRRYQTLLQTLAPLAPLVRGARVLDFGSAHGPSLCALLELGAAQVVGVETDPERVEKGAKMLAVAGLTERAEIRWERDTTCLPFPEGAFPLVLANAVLEHIPQPRDAFVRELWRLTAPGGHLIVNETPNRYLPLDSHTTGLLFVPWLPARLAERYAALRGRHPGEEWSQCGWRGIGYFELVRPLSDYELVPEQSRARHRLLHRLGIPASLLDPYPTWVLRRGRGARGR